MQSASRVCLWMDRVNLAGERTWALYETDVAEGSWNALTFFRVRTPGSDKITYYQDPISYVSHKADLGVKVELLNVDIEAWRARRRNFNLKRCLGTWSETAPSEPDTPEPTEE